VSQRGRERAEQSSAICHCERIVADSEHSPRSVVSGDNEQSTVTQQRSTLAAAQ
jgi:hypothetical protein